MKILVTGAAGFIGFHTSKKLLERGDTIVGLDNFNDYYDVTLKDARASILQQYDDFKMVRVELQDRERIEALFADEKFDKVIHLAAQAGVRYSIENPHSYIESNIVGTLLEVNQGRLEAHQLTRILLCGDTKLGAIKFKLFEPVKEIKRYVKQVNKKEEWIEEAQKDENGNPIKDDWGEPLIEEKLITKSDTIWGRKLLIKEREVFDSQKNSTGKSYWQQEAKKSKRLVIEAIIPKGDPDISGCVNVRVGYKMKKKKQFTFE